MSGADAAADDHDNDEDGLSGYQDSFIKNARRDRP